MRLFGNLFGGRKSGTRRKVEFDANGRVSIIDVPPGRWVLKQQGNNRYYSQKANSLLEATEVLKKVESIRGLSYYVVETADGALGRDTNGFYTEAPIKTKGIALASMGDKREPVEFESLMDYGDPSSNKQGVAALKVQGQYARFVLMMKCGSCGYESPVETEAGSLVRECYCCGAENSGSRGAIFVALGSRMVNI